MVRTAYPTLPIASSLDGVKRNPDAHDFGVPVIRAASYDGLPFFSALSRVGWVARCLATQLKQRLAVGLPPDIGLRRTDELVETLT
jgi:hypothetical protein